MESQNKGYIPLLRTDSDKIEKAYLAERLNEPILIDDNFFLCNIGARLLTHAYDDDVPARRLLRGTWFYVDSALQSLQPFDESVASQISAWFEEEKERSLLRDAVFDKPPAFRSEALFRLNRVNGSRSSSEKSESNENIKDKDVSLSRSGVQVQSEHGVLYKFVLSRESAPRGQQTDVDRAKDIYKSGVLILPLL